MMKWLITFYCACLICTGKHPGESGYGITASGRAVHEMVTVACTPALLGRRILIEGIGVRRCDDTGRLVVGHHVDVYVSGHAEAKRLGRRWRRVVVLP